MDSIVLRPHDSLPCGWVHLTFRIGKSVSVRSDAIGLGLVCGSLPKADYYSFQ